MPSDLGQRPGMIRTPPPRAPGTPPRTGRARCLLTSAPGRATTIQTVYPHGHSAARTALTVISESLLCTRLFLIHNAIWPERLLTIGISTLTAAIPILLLVGLGTSFRKSRNN